MPSPKQIRIQFPIIKEITMNKHGIRKFTLNENNAAAFRPVKVDEVFDLPTLFDATSIRTKSHSHKRKAILSSATQDSLDCTPQKRMRSVQQQQEQQMQDRAPRNLWNSPSPATPPTIKRMSSSSNNPMFLVPPPPPKKSWKGRGLDYSRRSFSCIQEKEEERGCGVGKWNCKKRVLMDINNYTPTTQPSPSKRLKLDMKRSPSSSSSTLNLSWNLQGIISRMVS